jgi:hypothetical protein
MYLCLHSAWHTLFAFIILHAIKILPNVLTSSVEEEAEADYFSSIVRSWTTICTKATNNIVLPRNDGLYVKTGNTREWSLVDSEINYLASPHKNDERHWCLTTTQVKSAISLPIRRQPCLLKWYSEKDICMLMQKYSVVVWNGDSLTRHMTQGLFMLWTKDFRFGGYPRHPNIEDDLFDFCGCDGQFSEHELCRSYSPGSFRFEDARSVGLCSRIDPYVSPRFYYQYAKYDESVTHLCSAEPNLRFVYLQGGTHYMTNASMTISQYLHPSLIRLVR